MLQSTSVDNLTSFSGALLDLAGSPIKIAANGLDVTVGIGTVEITRNGDNATVSFGLTSPEQVRGIDFSVGVRVTASTQDGPFDTIQNRNGVAGRHAQQAGYLMGPEHFRNSFFPMD